MLKSNLSFLLLLPLFMLNACGQTNKNQNKTQKTIAMENVISKLNSKNYFILFIKRHLITV